MIDYAKDPLLEKIEIAPGYSVTGGQIFRNSDGYRIKDVEIIRLNFSVRAQKVFMQNGIHMLSELVGKSAIDLMSFRGMGISTVNDILKKINIYLICNKQINCQGETFNCAQGEISPPSKELRTHLAEGYEWDGQTILRVSDGVTAQDAPIVQLNLSVKSYNCLMRAGFNYISKLINLPIHQVLSIPYLGRNALVDIMDKLDAYLKSVFPPEELVKSEKAGGAVEETKDSCDEFIGILDFPIVEAPALVLAPTYVFWKRKIVRRTDYAYINDVSVRELELGVRASNCLARSGIDYISKLINMPFESLHAIRNMGIGTAKEIEEKLSEYLKRRKFCALSSDAISKTLAIDSVLALFEEQPFRVFSAEDIITKFAHKSETLVLAALQLLEEQKRVEICDGSYILKLRSVFDVIEQVFSPDEAGDNRQKSVLERRLHGLSLEEIGAQEALSRERVRQIEVKAWQRIYDTKPIAFKEDRYAYFFQNYEYNKELLLQLLDDNFYIHHYLNIRYERGTKDLREALEDDRLSVADKRKIEGWLYRKCFLFENKYIELNRANIEDIVLEQYCKEETSFEEFCVCYTDFLKHLGLEEDQSLALPEATKKVRINRLAASYKCLWKRGQRLRYYDILGRDYTELLECLNLAQYQNTEISTLKFIRDYPDLMVQYDIRDEYELHNLLKKIGTERENATIQFEIMPMVRFGEFDRDEAVKQAMFELAPITIDEFATHLSVIYGARIQVVKNWFACIEPYCHQGLYSVGHKIISDENIKLLKAHLTDDFYYFSEIKKIYANLIPGADVSEICAFNMKRLGFYVNGNYVYKNYSSAEAYFKHLFSSSDMIDATPFHSRLISITAYHQVWKDFRRNYDIVEYEPLRYISISKLQEMGVNREVLREFCDQVYAFVEKGSYFTVEYLKNQGLVSNLDHLGFGLRFYIALLREDVRFSYCPIGNNFLFVSDEIKMFVSGNQYVSIRAFVTNYMQKAISIHVDDLLEKLKDEYNLVIDRSKMIEECKSADLYYDRISQTLYVDYDTYFRHSAF